LPFREDVAYSAVTFEPTFAVEQEARAFLSSCKIANFVHRRTNLQRNTGIWGLADLLSEH
jgi:hypothetical protein